MTEPLTPPYNPNLHFIEQIEHFNEDGDSTGLLGIIEYHFENGENEAVIVTDCPAPITIEDLELHFPKHKVYIEKSPYFESLKK